MPEIKTKSQYMNFVVKEYEGRKTPIVEIQSKSGGFKLGDIKWYPGWKKYCLMPVSNTVFSEDCLEDIKKVIRELKQLRK